MVPSIAYKAAGCRFKPRWKSWGPDTIYRHPACICHHVSQASI